MANKSPPITGEGIQNFSKKLIRFFKNFQVKVPKQQQLTSGTYPIESSLFTLSVNYCVFRLIPFSL